MCGIVYILEIRTRRLESWRLSPRVGCRRKTRKEQNGPHYESRKSFASANGSAKAYPPPKLRLLLIWLIYLINSAGGVRNQTRCGDYDKEEKWPMVHNLA